MGKTKGISSAEDRYVNVQVRQCLKAADGDAPKAVEILIARLYHDDNLWETLVERFLEAGCYSLVLQARAEERRRHWKAQQNVIAEQEKGGGRLLQATRARIASILEYPLSTGVKLGEATRKELEAERELFRGQAQVATNRAEWFGLIAAPLKAQQKVKSHWTAMALDALLDQCGRS